MGNHYKILLVDDDPRVLEMLDQLFKNEYSTLLASSGKESIELIQKNEDVAAVVMDIKMSEMDGVEAARVIRQIAPGVPVIFHTGYPGDFDEDEIDERERPFDYIQKGEPVSKLTRSVRNAVESFRLKKNDHAWMAGHAEQNYGLIGDSAPMQQVYQLIRRVSASDTKVIIMGETGTGKELAARAIHFNSRRKDSHFAFLSCNRKSPDIIESELFGHIKGAFTGAIENRIGLFEYANHGSVFLDEVGDLDISTQGKLLRVLESGEFQSIGSPEVKTTDIRILCATHKNLEDLTNGGHFRQDLYFRLKGITIIMPPLRERRGDIPKLVERFKDKFTIEQGLPPKIFDTTALDALAQHDWPGNVRQLLETVESLIILCDSDIIVAHDVQSYLGKLPSSDHGTAGMTKNLAIRLREFRRSCILEALSETNGNVSAAASLLGLDPSNLRRLMKSLEITSQ